MSDFIARDDAARALSKATSASRRSLAVTDRGIIAINSLSNGTDTSTTYRVKHLMQSGQAASDLRLAFPNWYVTGSGEVNGSDNITVSASIEFPSGTFYPVFFSGRRQAVVEPGSTLVSDAVSGIDIPASSGFWVRTYVSVASVGQKWPIGTYTGGVGNNDGATAGSDLTTSGTVTTGSFFAYAPVAVYGALQIPQKAIGIVGDSVEYGNGDAANTEQSFVDFAVNGRFGVIKIARPSELVSGAATLVNRRLRFGLLEGGVTDVICGYGTNDYINHATSAAIQTNLQTIWTALKQRNLSVYQTTLTPHTTSTDGWSTLANQTVNASDDANRQTVNTYIRTSPSPLAGFFDVATAAESGVTGKWSVASIRTVSDAAITSGAKTLTSATANFTSADVGFGVYIAGAAAASGAYVGQIISVTNTTTAVLDTNAGTTVSGATSSIGTATTDGIHPVRAMHQLMATRVTL